MGYPVLIVQNSVCRLSSLECANDCGQVVLLQLCKVVSAGCPASGVQSIVGGLSCFNCEK